jgi:hypothetical protein
MRPLVRLAAGGQASGATGNFDYARGMPEGQGKIPIAPGAPPAKCRERKAAGESSGLEKRGGAYTALRVHLHARMLEQRRNLGFRGLLPRLIPNRL